MRNNRRTGRCLAASGGVALVALFLWGWFSAALVAPAPTPLLLDRQGGFLAQLPAADEAGYGYWAIDTLPPAQRQVIVLRDVEGCSPEEVCETLGVSDGNQRVLLHRARAKVRAMLEPHLRRTA